MQPFSLAQGDRVVENFPANGTPGEVISVRTDLGNRVHAWRPIPPITSTDQTGYFCHGYSLDTYLPPLRYTVMSKEAITRVLADEYLRFGTLVRNIPLPVIQAGDIAVFWYGNDAVHSARIVTAVMNGTQLNPDLTTVNSKTGTGVLRQNVPLTVVQQDYPKAVLIEFYRHV